MTSVYDADGQATPVTVIEAGDNFGSRVKTTENDGYSAVQVGFDTQKESRVTKPLLGEFKKAGIEPKKFIREFVSPRTHRKARSNLSVTQFAGGRLC